MNWDLFANVFVAIGTLALATTPFLQARHSILDQRARAQASVADGVYLPVRMELESIREATSNTWASVGAPRFTTWQGLKKNEPLITILVPEELVCHFDAVDAAAKQYHGAVDDFYRVAQRRFSHILGQNELSDIFDAGLIVRSPPHSSLSTRLSPKDVVKHALDGGGFESFIQRFEDEFPGGKLEYQICIEKIIIADVNESPQLMKRIFEELPKLPEFMDCLKLIENLVQAAAAAWECVQSELEAVARLVQRHHI